jgi:hypothetical protein
MTAIESEKYSIRPVHDTLYVDLKGTWNHEDTYQFTSDYKQLVSRYFARSWCCVFKINELEMLIDEDYQIPSFKALNTWSFIKGMGAFALVTSIENRDYLIYQFDEVLRGRHPFEASSFNAEEDADDWLKLRGFQVNGQPSSLTA